MGADGTDPRAVRSIVVTAADLIAAVEARRQRGKQVVLRMNPPFSGRMRARLHVPAENSDTDDIERTKSVLVDPVTLLCDDAPAYPRPADTEDALRADPEAKYTVERHHQRHEAAVDRWREEIRDYVVDKTTLETHAGSHTVEVTVLG